MGSITEVARCYAPSRLHKRNRHLRSHADTRPLCFGRCHSNNRSKPARHPFLTYRCSPFQVDANGKTFYHFRCLLCAVRRNPRARLERLGMAGPVLYTCAARSTRTGVHADVYSDSLDGTCSRGYARNRLLRSVQVYGSTDVVTRRDR